MKDKKEKLSQLISFADFYFFFLFFRCGADSVIGNWSNQLLIVGLSGACYNYPYSNLVHLVPEIDGVRILSSFAHETIQKVLQVTQKVFRINSTEPGSYLLEASKQYEKKSLTSYEYIW